MFATIGVMPQNIVCETSTKALGNMDFRFGEPKAVIENRTQFLQKKNIAYQDHIAMRCDHGSSITLVSSLHPSVGARTQEDQVHSEVLITQEKNLALMLFTADCQSMSLYDPVTHTIALAHISRQTLCNNLSTKVVEFLTQELSVKPEDLLVNIGPSIQKESYSFPLPLDAVHPALFAFIEERDGYAFIDLPSAHTQELLSLGITKDHLFVSNEDTASEKYFSYAKAKHAKQPDPGRMATILMMR